MLLQAKLLRTLQERKIRRVGGREEIDVDVRIVAATARNLDEMIRQEQFRQDLYYRINVVRIDLPPLRERGDDIGLLAEYMVHRYGREMGRPVKAIAPEAYQVLLAISLAGQCPRVAKRDPPGHRASEGAADHARRLAGRVVDAAGQGRATGDVGYFELRDEHLGQLRKAVSHRAVAAPSTATSARPPTKPSSPAARSTA